MKSYRRRNLTYWTLPLILMLAISGCLKQEPEHKGAVDVSQPPNTNASAGENKTENTTVGADATDLKSEPSISSGNDTETGQTVKTNKNDADGKVKQAEQPKKQDNGTSKYDVNDPFNPEKPSLMGLSVGMDTSKVAEKFGKPVKQFMMEDEVAPITVYDYTGFSVGFDQAGKLEFVDVSSSEVNPGLNGLRIGQQSSAAVKAIGQPDTKSEYVLSYRTKNAILKIDLDPKTQVINSIKLFANTD